MKFSSCHDCVNYPTEAFQSYNSCDDKYIWSNIPDGLVPIWLADAAADDFNSVTREAHFPNAIEGFGDLFDGSQSSNCPVPCNTFNAVSHIISSRQSFLY